MRILWRVICTPLPAIVLFLGMILLDKPYVSDFLVKTIRENGYDVVSTAEASELVKDNEVNWISEEAACNFLGDGSGKPLYTNSENALAWIIGNFESSSLAGQIRLLKDKTKFRELIRSDYPGFHFMKVNHQDILKINPQNIGFPFVIKPSIGFFSLGVHVVKNRTDWHAAVKEITGEKEKGMFPAEVLSTSEFIIEAYIEGEEYAIDCYFNKDGEAVILNILHHRFSSGSDTSDRVYVTSRDIIFDNLVRFEKFLNNIGQKAGLVNFPAHVELRMDGAGNIIPIEINPLRFGGFCTTGDLPGIALGYNSYELYFQNQAPDWDKIYGGREGKLYGLIVLNNNSGYDPDEIQSFDYKKLAVDLEKPLSIRSLDIRKYPVFGFVFTETSAGNEDELDRILVSDLKRYITKKEI
jgi:hypothetical protein